MVKFRLSPDETYEVKLQEEYSEEELPRFFELIEKIKNMTFVKKPEYVLDLDRIKTKKIEEIENNAHERKKRKYTRRGKYNKKKIIKDNSEQNSEQKPIKKRENKQWLTWDDRDEVINALRIHYRGTPELKQRFANMKRTEWKNILWALHGLKKRYKITPEEVGLKEFPKRGEHWGRKKEQQQQQKQNIGNQVVNSPKYKWMHPFQGKE